MMSARKEKVLEALEKTIEEGQKPSAQGIAQHLNWTVQDVHRCLNILEKEGKIVSYRKKILGFERRMIGVNRT